MALTFTRASASRACCVHDRRHAPPGRRACEADRRRIHRARCGPGKLKLGENAPADPLPTCFAASRRPPPKPKTIARQALFSGTAASGLALARPCRRHRRLQGRRARPRDTRRRRCRCACSRRGARSSRRRTCRARRRRPRCRSRACSRPRARCAKCLAACLGCADLVPLVTALHHCEDDIVVVYVHVPPTALLGPVTYICSISMYLASPLRELQLRLHMENTVWRRSVDASTFGVDSEEGCVKFYVENSTLLRLGPLP
jgi:hypothetical protein